MSKKPNEITEENVLEVDVDAIAIDRRFPELEFQNSKRKLKNAQKWLIEVKGLNYEEILEQNDVALVEKLKIELKELLQNLLTFENRTTEANKQQEHDDSENRTDGYYNEVYNQLAMRILPFLREERRREEPEERKIDEEIRRITQIRKGIEGEFEKVKKETDMLRTADKAISSAKGERAAVRLEVHFSDEAGRYEDSASRWFWGSVIGYLILLVILIKFGVEVYLDGTISNLTGNLNRDVILSVGIAKLVFISALWYGLSFIVKNYRVNSHLAAVSRHRASVASTLEDFMVTEKQQKNPRLSEMLQNATKAMFKHVPVGFISKAERDSGNPLFEIINKISNPKSE